MCEYSRNGKQPLPSKIGLYQEHSVPMTIKDSKMDEQANCVRVKIIGTTKPDFHFYRLYLHFAYERKGDLTTPNKPRPYLKLIFSTTKMNKFWHYELLPHCKDASQLVFDFCIRILITGRYYKMKAHALRFARCKDPVPPKGIQFYCVDNDVKQLKMDRAVVDCYAPVKVDAATVQRPGADQKRVQHKSQKMLKITNASCLLFDNRINFTDTTIDIPMPYYGELPAKVLPVGRCLKVVGQFYPTSRSFQFALQHGSQSPELLFLFELRFTDKTEDGRPLARACCYSGKKWHKNAWLEVAKESKLRQNHCFSLYVVHRPNALEVYSGSELLLKYEHHASLEMLDSVFVNGDFRMLGLVMQDKFKPRMHMSKVRITRMTEGNKDCEQAAENGGRAAGLQGRHRSMK